MNAILSLLVNLIMIFSIAIPINVGAAMDDIVTPEAASADLMKTISTCDTAGCADYMDNDYIFFLVNTEGDKDIMKRRNKALFENFTFQVEDTAQRGNLAVAKMKVTNSDFSNVMEYYDKDSQKYIKDNLYSSEVADKEKLTRKCFDIYVESIEEAAKSGNTVEYEFFLPMHFNNRGQWVADIDEGIMSKIMGNLEVPEIGD